MIEAQIFPLILAFLLVVFAWANRRLKLAAQPLRLLLAEHGEKLLSDPNLPLQLNSVVRHMLDTAFGLRANLLFGLFYTPYLAGQLVFTPEVVRAQERAFDVPDKDTRARFDHVMRLHDRITFANNPILMLLVELEILLLIPVSIVLSGIFHSRLTESADRDMAMTMVEASLPSFLQNFRTSELASSNR